MGQRPEPTKDGQNNPPRQRRRLRITAVTYRPFYADEFASDVDPTPPRNRRAALEDAYECKCAVAGTASGDLIEGKDRGRNKQTEKSDGRYARGRRHDVLGSVANTGAALGTGRNDDEQGDRGGRRHAKRARNCEQTEVEQRRACRRRGPIRRCREARVYHLRRRPRADSHPAGRLHAATTVDAFASKVRRSGNGLHHVQTGPNGISSIRTPPDRRCGSTSTHCHG